jgi:hypothetical protein
MNYARSEHPEVLQKTVEEKPFRESNGQPCYHGRARDGRGETRQ